MAKMPTGEMTQGVITDEMIEDMRQRAGTRVRLTGYIANEIATETAIRRFVDGVGDSNPLWRNEKYAKNTRYGRIVAPHSWVWSVCAAVQMGWRGLGAFHSGTEEKFFRPILLGDRITPEVVYLGFEGPMPSHFAGKMIKDCYENRYYNQKGELVAKVRLWIIRYERKKAYKKGKYKDVQLPHPWTEEELKNIQNEVLAEEIRGANPRYWEEVSVGEQLKPLTKGPFGLTDMIAFIAGAATPARLLAHGVALRHYVKHPAWAFRDPETYALEPIFAVHYNRRAANLQGLPSCYDLGQQRQCWLDHFLINWMGDEGWLKRVFAEYRYFVYHSDVLCFNGKVTNKYIDENNENCVDIEVTVINQREENVMPATATIILSSRDKGISPVSSRLR